ncbi:hypothetical protein Tco_1442752 [Tanacetum coccineum]
MTNKIDTMLKAITEQLIKAPPRDTVKHPRINIDSTPSASSAHSYPMRDPQGSNPIHGSINKITWFPKKPEKPHNDEPTEEVSDLENTNHEPHPQPDPLSSIATETFCKLSSFVGNLDHASQTPDAEFVCTKEEDRDIMKRKLKPREDRNSFSGVSNFVARVRASRMTHDLGKGVVRFINGECKVAYKMPHKIEQYYSLIDEELEHTKFVYFRNQEDREKGVDYVMNKILGFYKECLELGPEYVTGLEDEGEVM